MVTGDGAYIKKINRSIILQRIFEHGMISRAELAKMTGLNKATISVQVADLLEEELICETQQEHNTIGRRPIMLSINRKAGFVLGIDLDYKKIQYTISDLLGYPVHNETIHLETKDYDEIVQTLIQHIKAYSSQYPNSHYGLISVMIGIHGTVSKDEEIFFVPRYKWHNKNLKADLEKELSLNIHIENNANLSSYAEKVYKHHESSNLLTIILTSGIGAGIMVNGEIHKGYHGYAGEMGHMIVSPKGELCKCGNYGCWELYSAEPSLFKQLAKKTNKPLVTYEDIHHLLNEKDPIIYELMEQFMSYLAIGLNNVINLYNPETIVLNSEVLKAYPKAVEVIKSKLISSVSQYREIVLSELGNEACVMGACALAIQQFFEVPDLIINISDCHIPSSCPASNKAQIM